MLYSILSFLLGIVVFSDTLDKSKLPLSLALCLFIVMVFSFKKVFKPECRTCAHFKNTLCINSQYAIVTDMSIDDVDKFACSRYKRIWRD